MDRALTPSPRRDRALARGVAALLLLGAHHAAVEYRPAFALWSLGRPCPWAPAAALLALHALALSMLLTRHIRASAATAAAVIATLYAAVPATYHNNHFLLFVLLVLVAVAPSASSVDHRTDPPTRTPIDLAGAIRWQLGLVYLSSVAVKLAHPWWRGSGEVIRWLATTRTLEANPDAIVPRLLSPILSRPLPSRLADLAVTLLEALLPLALASPRTRRPAVALGVLLHLSMQEWLFPQLFTFLMLLGYFAWSPADDRAWTLTPPRGADPDRVARALDRVDPLARIALAPSLDSPRWTLTDPSGRAFHGAWAVLPLALLTPHAVIAYAALALVLPELRAIGPIPRDALENVLVGSLLAAAAVRLLLDRGAQLPGRKNSHPR
jgi:hypothetical protein